MGNIRIDRDTAESLIAKFPDMASFADQLKISNRIEVPFGQLDGDRIDALNDLYRQAGEGATKIALLDALKASAAGVYPAYEAGNFEQMLPDLIAYLSEGAERGWLFKLDGSDVLKPYVVSRFDFTPAGGDESARLVMELRANACGKLAHPHIIFSERDVIGRTLPDILAAKGYVRETPDLLAAYDATAETFFDWRNRFNEQFTGNGVGVYAEDPASTHRNTDFARKKMIVLAAGEGPAHLVNDEAILTERDLTLEASGAVLAKLLKRMDRESGLSQATDNAVMALVDQCEGLFKQVPVHAYIFVFHLELHHHLWVHIDNLEPYTYKPELKDKLVLPKEHVDLIDILTAEMDLLMDDIVEGKSGGTTVLCSGPAGVGKTLTAEVYSEIIRRPLYRVHSGQLGLNVAEMEKTLKEVLIRAQRWGAVMLIDEADVYIKRRDDDLEMNAVVGVFLRILEYFNGLLFLTTNRSHDIDEAIISRCIAMIRYQAPSRDERVRIWAVMADQFGLALEPALLETLADQFPQASGRDIKGLAKLVFKYCSYHEVKPDMAVFDHCAIFRGLDLNGSA